MTSRAHPYSCIWIGWTFYFYLFICLEKLINSFIHSLVGSYNFSCFMLCVWKQILMLKMPVICCDILLMTANPVYNRALVTGGWSEDLHQVRRVKGKRGQFLIQYIERIYFSKLIYKKKEIHIGTYSIKLRQLIS